MKLTIYREAICDKELSYKEITRMLSLDIYITTWITSDTTLPLFEFLLNSTKISKCKYLLPLNNGIDCFCKLNLIYTMIKYSTDDKSYILL